MSHHPYNPRVVVEKTPNALLARLLFPYAAFADLDWSTIAENDSETILRRVRAMKESERRVISVRLRQVHALANSRGTTALIAAAGDAFPQLAAHLKPMRNAYERACWCLVEHAALFDSPTVYAHIYSLPKASRETRVGFPEGHLAISEPMIDNLRAQIQVIFEPEKRAEKCMIDYREQDGIHLIHAYPSDYADEIDSYGPAGELVDLSVEPPFHIVYFLDETTGSLSVLSKGGDHKVDALFDGFGKAVFATAAPPKAGKKTYDLSFFKNPDFEFKSDPADHLASLRVTAMKLQFPGTPQGRARYEIVDHDDRHADVYSVLRSELRGGFDKLARATVLSVDLEATFAGPGGAEEAVEFRITAPRWCTLGHEGKEGVLRRCLRLSGIEIDGKRVAALP